MGEALYDICWRSQGISILWDDRALREICTNHDEVVSLRQFMQFWQHGWPDDLPSGGGDTLVVAGLDACIDSLSPEKGVEWLENYLYKGSLTFQQNFEEQAALVFWMPEGKNRVQANALGDSYYWLCDGEYQHESIPLSRCIYNGAEKNAQPIMFGGSIVGLYIRRIS